MPTDLEKYKKRIKELEGQLQYEEYINRESQNDISSMESFIMKLLNNNQIKDEQYRNEAWDHIDKADIVLNAHREGYELPIELRKNLSEL